MVEKVRMLLDDARRLESFAVAIYLALIGSGVILGELTARILAAITFSALIAVVIVLKAFQLRDRTMNIWERVLKRDPDHHSRAT
ncbi:MAG: hypothetical protein F7B17_05585 [Desulfurococcales archaeon]|nr:hypothetical protein [Desulfurococcales archaeon]